MKTDFRFDFLSFWPKEQREQKKKNKKKNCKRKQNEKRNEQMDIVTYR